VEVRDLIRKMSESDPSWGSPRIRGELRKLGIDVAKSTVEKYRVRQCKPPSPAWRAFLSNHMKELVSLDFFTVSTVRFNVLFVLIILAHDRRGRCHQSLEMDCPEPRAVQPPEVGGVVEVVEAGGLYRHYERLAA